MDELRPIVGAGEPLLVLAAADPHSGAALEPLVLGRLNPAGAQASGQGVLADRQPDRRPERAHRLPGDGGDVERVDPVQPHRLDLRLPALVPGLPVGDRGDAVGVEAGRLRHRRQLVGGRLDALVGLLLEPS